MTQATYASLPAPIAPRRPHSFTTHGITVTDDYAWLKDAKWQEVLRDPAILDPDIRRYLEEENDYTESLLGHTAALQKKLVAEMRGRIKEDNSSVPSPDGPFAYFRKFREGGQHEMFGRHPRDGGEAEIVLDGDALAADYKYFKFGGSRHSPDHDCRPGARTSRARSISRSGCAIGSTPQTSTTSSRRPTGAWSGTPARRPSIT